MRAVPMRIEVDSDACTGHGRCWSLAPEVFDADDDGYCATRERDVPPELEEQARRAAANCPERAITVHLT
jgi:ferredoxin